MCLSVHYIAFVGLDLGAQEYFIMLVLIIRILILHIANKQFGLVIPTLEMPAGQLHQRLNWCGEQRFDIHFSDIALTLILSTARFVSLTTGARHRGTYMTL